MPSRRATALAAILALAAPARLLAAEGAATIHLEWEQGAASGYTRPKLANEACLVEALAERPAAAGFDGKVRFNVQRDGRLAELAFLSPATPAMEQAVRSALQACPWSQGLDPEGRPVVVRVTQPLRILGQGVKGTLRGRADRADDPGVPPPPVVLGGGSLRLDGAQAGGFRRPVLDDAACLPVALQRQRGAAGVENTVKFAVMRDGSVTHFSFLSPVAPEVERAVVTAFEACRWKPALDPEGEPLAVWVVQPIKVAPLPPPPEAQRPLFP